MAVRGTSLKAMRMMSSHIKMNCLRSLTHLPASPDNCVSVTQRHVPSDRPKTRPFSSPLFCVCIWSISCSDTSRSAPELTSLLALPHHLEAIISENRQIIDIVCDYIVNSRDKIACKQSPRVSTPLAAPPQPPVIASILCDSQPVCC